MTSTRKIAANRQNAARSTGPRSAAGRARSSQNALDHGLARCLAHTIEEVSEIKYLADALAGANPSPEALARARMAAVAELEIVRVRQARCALVNHMSLDDTTFAPPKGINQNKNKLERSIRKVLAEAGEFTDVQLRADPTLRADIATVKRKAELLTRHAADGKARPMPTDPDRCAVAFGAAQRQLLRYDRYERRAFSRRKRALRALDDLRNFSKAQQSDRPVES